MINLPYFTSIYALSQHIIVKNPQKTVFWGFLFVLANKGFYEYTVKIPLGGSDVGYTTKHTWRWIGINCHREGGKA